MSQGFFMNRIIHFVQNLSLDITLGSVISSMFLAKVMGVEVTSSMMIGLAIAIWLIYTFDHLRDAFKTQGKATNPRHAFHQKYFKPVAGISVVVFSLGVYNLQFLPWYTIEIGLVLVVLSGLYFIYLMLAKRAINKELFAATVYVAGIATAPLSQVNSFQIEWLLVLMVLWILAYGNLLIIPLYELELDEKDNQESIVTRMGLKKVRSILIWLLFFCTVLIQFYGYEGGNLTAYAILLLMVFTLIVLLVRPQYFRQFQLYRILSDGIFFLPGIMLLL